jgi:hypothetical protein
MKAKYESKLHVEGDLTGRKNLRLPEEIYDAFITLAGELGFSHKGRVAIVPFLDAISQLQPEDLESVLADADLMPKRGEDDSLWG